MLFSNLPAENPFQIFQDYYSQAEDHGDKFAEAGCISSVDKNNQPHSRFVNFKYFFEDNLVFFSNYGSLKAQNFIDNDPYVKAGLFSQISLVAWDKKTD